MSFTLWLWTVIHSITTQCALANINQPHSYAPIVDQLQQYVLSNVSFAAELNATFREANQSNVTYNDMYSLFNRWLNQVPIVNENCTVYTMLDLSPFSDTQTGNQILRYNITTEWFYNYLNDWKNFLDSNESAFIVPNWMKCVNMSQYIIPANGYSSFNQFFYREINMQYRPISNISDNSIVVSPADGFVIFIERNINYLTRFNVKGENFNITQMLNNSKYVNRFDGGDLMEIVLNINNYHRYHSSINGYIEEIDQLAGWYFVDNGRNDHCQDNSNRRGVVYTTLDDGAMIAAVHVGFSEISSINFNVLPKTKVNKGDEIGYFAYGGSAIVLLFEPGYVERFTVRMNEDVIVGQQVAKTKYKRN